MAICLEDGCARAGTSRGYCGMHYLRRKRSGEFVTKYKAPWGLNLAFLQENVGFAGAECLMWPFGGGYGKVRYRDRKENAHRVMCMLAHGDPPFVGAEAAHSCGKQGCVNPNHLRWATHAQNLQDKVKHGTDARGEKQWAARLTADEVLLIKRDARKQKQIAAAYGISTSYVSHIKAGRAWAHVGDSPCQ